MTETEIPGFLEARGLKPATQHAGPKYARRLVELGVHVHPLRYGSKLPATENGVLDASLDPSVIAGNYGISVKASNLIGIDLDDYVDGAQTDQFVADFGLESTFTIRTGSGGRCMLFRAPEGLDYINGINFAGYRGVDVRGRNGYVVGPGSKISASEIKKGGTGDGTYTFDADGSTEFAPITSKLAEALAEAAKPKEYDPEVLERTARAAAYEAMDPATKLKVDAWLDRVVGGIMGELEAMKTWPEGYREKNHKGEEIGWEEGVWQKCGRLAQVVNADWNPLGKDDVIGLLRQHLPHDASYTLQNGLSKFARSLQTMEGAHMPEFEDEYDMLDGVEDRSPKGGSDGTGEEVTYEAKLVGGVQGHILFDTNGCRRIQVDDNGKEKEKEVLPATTARRLIESWPIAKQPLSRAQNWWVYKDGAWILNDSVVRLSMAASFADSYKTADVAPVEDVLSTMADEIEVQPHSDFINFTNGMLEWKTGELHEHAPSYYSTVQIPHAWNPEATCAGFDQWLVERLPIAGVKLAWQLIAATLHSGIVSQRAGLLYGVGKSGKSTFLELVQGLVGAWNCSALSPQAMTKTVFATHALLGKQANIVTDIDPTRITETAIFKQVVAGEPIQAQQKNKPEFTFRPFCNHLFSANQIPRSSDRTSAWTRRFAILRFTEVIGGTTQIIDRFDKILLREAEGIIAKALTFLPELVRDGYSLVEADQEEFEAATDFTKDFWTDAVEISGNPLDFTPTVHLAQAFDMWCQTNRIRLAPPFADVELALRDNPIVERARKRPAGAGRTGSALRGWKGVVLQPEYRPQVAQTPIEDLF